MSDYRLMGVSKTVREDQIVGLPEADQDTLIREIGLALETDLREHVKGAIPKGDLVYQLQGPHMDPLQGKVWVHVLAGHFDLDALDRTSTAWLAYATNPDPSQPAIDTKVPE